MTLNHHTISKILALHDIETFQHEGKLYAVDAYTRREGDAVITGEAIVDVTESTQESLQVFLHY